MSFSIAQKPDFTVPVSVFTANENGKFDESKFKAKFKRCTIDDLDRLRDMTAKDTMREVLLGWSDLLDENKNQVAFDEATREILISIPEALGGLREAFWTSIFKAEKKN